MSGGKETPRQKMIGMMYLVLTALLALNVSSTVIDKFVFLNASLEQGVSEAGKRNSQTLQSIEKLVSETGNREADVKVMELAKEIRNEAAAIINELDTLKTYFVKVTGGIDETGELIGKTDYERVGHEMMAEGGNDYGVPLKARLNDFAEFMAEKLGEEFEPIALDADDDPYWKNDPNQAGKDFATLNFQGAPTPAGMATVSEFESRVMQYETRALDILARKVGAGDISFDQIKLMVKSQSNKVAAGTRYEAELFLTASASGIKPTMTVNGEDIPVDSNGMGLVNFPATPGSYNAQGEAKKSFIGAISFTMPGGKDTLFVDTIDYYVVRPVMQIQSASVQALYLNCGNELNIQVPALGTNYNPTYSAQGAATIPGSKKGDVTVVPSAAEVTLRVSSNGTPVGNQVFKVRRIPKPEIVAYNRGRVIDLKGVSQAPRILQLRANADESFGQFLPKDARYQVAQSEITLVRRGREVQSIRGNGPNVNIAGIASQARSGDNIVVEIRKVQRANFRNQVEDVNNFGPKIITIPISGG